MNDAQQQTSAVVDDGNDGDVDSDGDDVPMGLWGL